MSVLPVLHSIYDQAVLFDTSALIAITDPRDQYRDEAVQLLTDLIERSYPLYVTPLTIAETHRQILYRSHLAYSKALKFLELIYDGSINIIRPIKEDELQGIGYIRQYNDQNLTFTDVISMAVMKRIGIRQVFTFDWHFTLLGFRVIPPL